MGADSCVLLLEVPDDQPAPVEDTIQGVVDEGITREAAVPLCPEHVHLQPIPTSVLRLVVPKGDQGKTLASTNVSATMVVGVTLRTVAAAMYAR